MAADDGAGLEVPDRPGRGRPGGERRLDLPSGGAEQVPAEREGIGQRHQRILPVDQQRGQVMREMVGKRDRHDRPDQQAGRRRKAALPAAGQRLAGGDCRRDRRRRAAPKAASRPVPLMPIIAVRPGNSSGLMPFGPSQKKVFERPSKETEPSAASRNRRAGQRQRLGRRRAWRPGRQRASGSCRPALACARRCRSAPPWRRTPTGTRRAGSIRA